MLVLVATGDERTRREVRRIAEKQGFTTHDVRGRRRGGRGRAAPGARRGRARPRAAEAVGAAGGRAAAATTATTEAVGLFALADADELGEQSALFTACVQPPVDQDLLAAALDAVGARRAS